MSWGANTSLDLTLEIGILFLKQVNELEGERVQAYCVKCKSKKGIKSPKAIKMKNGKSATQGTCPSCGTKMFRIGKA